MGILYTIFDCPRLEGLGAVLAALFSGPAFIGLDSHSRCHGVSVAAGMPNPTYTICSGPVDDRPEPTGGTQGLAQVTIWVLECCHELLVRRQPLEIPEKDVAGGVTERQHGVLIGLEVQLESHEELRPTVGCEELKDASVLGWTLGGDGRDESRAGQPAWIVVVGRGYVLRCGS